MKRLLPPLLLVLLVLPTASAESLSGSLTASSVFLEGESTTESGNLILQLGAQPDSFERVPKVLATGETIVVQRSFSQRVLVCARPPDGACSGTVLPGADYSSSAWHHAAVQFDAWAGSKSELMLMTGPEVGLAGTGRAHDQFERPTPLTLTSREETIYFATDGQRGGVDPPFTLTIPVGALAFEPLPFPLLEYTGNFEVWIYGATFRVSGDEGTSEPFVTGHYEEQTSPATKSEWENITKLQFFGGSLLVEPNDNPVSLYATDATLLGDGLLHLDAATGLVRGNARDPYRLDEESVDFEGNYKVSVRSTSVDGRPAFAVGLSGKFDNPLLTPASAVATQPWAWWPLALAFALVAGAGTTGVLVYARRRDRPEPPAPAKAAQTVLRIRDGDPLPAVSTTPLPKPDSPDKIAGLAWDELTEEYGVVHAGQQAGVFVLLVPEERVESFIRSVTARGIMAEDTGDRVQAGAHPLAVIALEPSPIGMN